jgi:cell division protein FtsQ
VPTAILGVAALVTSAWAVSVSPAFELRTLEVTGLSHLTRRQVVSLSGVAQDENVLWLSAGAVASRLERSSPWIASAAVSRSLPGTVRIEIVEREPIAAVADGARWLLVAADGVVLQETRKDPGLPLIEGALAPPAGRPGGQGLSVGRSDPGLAAGARVLAAMGERLRSRIEAVVTGNEGVVVLRLRTGTRVLYGEATEATAKARTLGAVLRWADDTGATLERLDLRAPRAPSATLSTPPA